MPHTSSHTLKRLAALVWYLGVAVLLIKSSGLFLAASQSGASLIWVLVGLLGGLGIGSIKAKYLFEKVCRNNLMRIEALKKPRLWQFYRARFFVFLGLMVALGTYLSRLAQGDYRLLLPLAVVELSVAVALLGSSHCYWGEPKR